MGLTKRAIDAFEYDPHGPSAQILWDRTLPGFGCRVFRSGVRSFILDYRAGGRMRRLTLGRYGVLTPHQARERAVQTLGAVSGGADPAEERQTKRDAATVADGVREYLAEAEPRLKPRSLAEYRRILEKYVLPALGAKVIADVTPRDTARLHHARRATPYQANRLRDVLSAFMKWAEVRGHRPRGSNPCHDVKKFKERQRERFLTVAEIAALGTALRAAELVGVPPAPNLRRKPGSPETAKHRPKAADTPIPANPFAVAAIRFLLLTGWREQEALNLRWSDLDFDRRLATLQDTKTGKSHRPLGAPAMALLSELPRVSGSPYVFPGAQPGRPLREFKRTWYAVRHHAGLDGVRLHDLRHTVASFSVATGNSLYVTGSILGHTRAETTQRYAHLNQDVRQIAADAVSSAISEALQAEQPSPPRAQRLATG
jgi:integrase